MVLRDYEGLGSKGAARADSLKREIIYLERWLSGQSLLEHQLRPHETMEKRGGEVLCPTSSWRIAASR